MKGKKSKDAVSRESSAGPKMIRPHNKVRTGCTQCKNRRIKCDEGKPKCIRCVRYHEECIYLGISESEPESHIQPISPIAECSARNTSPSSSELTPESTSLTLSDLELLHQWTAQSYTGFTETPSGVQDNVVWQTDVPRLALQFPFVMRGILAISALHLSQLSPDTRRRDHYQDLASHHHAHSLRGYCQLISTKHGASYDAESHALLVSSHLTLAYSVGSGSCSSIEWMGLVRGCRRAMRQEASKGFLNYANDEYVSKNKRYLEFLVEGEVDCSLHPEDWCFTLLASEMDSVQGEGKEDMEIYREAVALLRRAFALPYQTSTVPPGIQFAMGLWMENVSQRFLDRLVARRPLAWVIMAYFAWGMKMLERAWFVRRLAEKTIEEVEILLGEEESSREWLSWVRCPKEMIERLERSQKERERGIDVQITDSVTDTWY